MRATNNRAVLTHIRLELLRLGPTRCAPWRTAFACFAICDRLEEKAAYYLPTDRRLPQGQSSDAEHAKRWQSVHIETDHY